MAYKLNFYRFDYLSIYPGPNVPAFRECEQQFSVGTSAGNPIRVYWDRISSCIQSSASIFFLFSANEDHKHVEAHYLLKYHKQV